MIRFRLALLVLLVASTARAGEPDIAKLFPAETLAFAELRDPAAIGPELAAVVKGSALEDSLKFVHERRDKTKNIRDLMATDPFGVLGLLTAPETIGEFRKIRGAAVALTNFNDRNEPDVAFTLLTGDSQALGLVIRAMLTVNPNVRKIGDASGVPVFQLRPSYVQHGPNGQPLPANEKPVEEAVGQPTFAYTPGLFVIGSSRAVVADVIGRYQDSTKKSLADEPAFQAAAGAHRKPGIFWFATPKLLCTKLDAARKNAGNTIDDDLYALLKMVGNAKEIAAASGTLAFRDRGLSLTADLSLEPGSTGPLLALLEGEAGDASSLKFLPTHTALGLSFALPTANRSAAALGFLDAIAKAQGVIGRKPGEAVAEITEKFKVAIADDLLAKTRVATVVLPSRQEVPKGALPLPTLVLHAESAAVATQWADGIRAIVADLSGSAVLPQPSTEFVDGVKVFSLPATNLPWKSPVHFASAGSVFAVGQDRKVVAACVKGTREAPVAPPGRELKGSAAIGVVSLGGLMQMASATTPDANTDGPKLVDDQPPTPADRRTSSGQPIDPELLKQEARSFEEMMNAIGALPPAVGSIRRVQNVVRIEWFAPEIQGPTTTKVIDRFLTWLDRRGAASGRDPGEDRQGFPLPQ